MADRITEIAKDMAIGLTPVGREFRDAISVLRFLFSGDCEVDECLNLFDERHRRGIDSYGISLTDADLDEAECIQHAREEAADLLKYLIKLRMVRVAKGKIKEAPDA